MPPINCQPYSRPFIPSPVKKRNTKKSQTIVVSQTKAIKLRELRAKLAKLAPPQTTTQPAETSSSWEDINMPTFTPDVTPKMDTDVTEEDIIVICELTMHRMVPDKATITQYERWLSLLLRLQEVYLEHLPHSVGIPLQPGQGLTHDCMSNQCPGSKTSKVLCLFLDCKCSVNSLTITNVCIDFEERMVPYCGCQPLPVILVRHGLFPAAPSQPRMAFAITLLDFYHSLFERACDAINALALALNTFYERRDFYLRNQQVCFMFLS